MRVLEPEPSRQHSSVGPTEGDDGGLGGSVDVILEVDEQRGVVGQRLLRAQISVVLGVGLTGKSTKKILF